MANKKTLVLFDFDGTITTRDTFLELIKFQKGSATFYTGFARLFPSLLLFKAGLVEAQNMKEKVMSFFWKGMDEMKFLTLCEEFNEAVMPKLIRSKAVTQLKDHLDKGHQVAVVSASAEDWIKPFCKLYSIKCIASKMERADGIITGKLNGINCNGQEKVNRIKANFNLEDYEQIVAYGDSKGDTAMLELASIKNFKPFR